MKHFLEWIQAFAMAIGGLGLAAIAFLDASFLSFPQANDILIVVMTVKDPAWMPYYAGMTLAGSLAGCLVLFFIARRGGEAMVRSRFKAHHVERATRLTNRYGLLTTLVASMMPPPVPLKLFVVMAGVAGMSAARFSAAIVLGRGLRYFGLGLLTVWYGEAAIDYLRSHGRTVSLALCALVVVGAASAWLWRRVRARRARGNGNQAAAAPKRPV